MRLTFECESLTVSEIKKMHFCTEDHPGLALNPSIVEDSADGNVTQFHGSHTHVHRHHIL